MSGNRERAAEVVDQAIFTHRERVGIRDMRKHCMCGASFTYTFEMRAHRARALIAALAAAGLLVTPDDDYAARWDADAQAIKGAGA